MDRNDGQDVRHYDSVEAIEAVHDPRDKVEDHVPPAGTTGAIRDANDISADELESERAVSDALVDDAEFGPLTDQSVADAYGETTADQDFDPGSDKFGMGLDESDDMVSPSE